MFSVNCNDVNVIYASYSWIDSGGVTCRLTISMSLATPIDANNRRPQCYKVN